MQKCLRLEAFLGLQNVWQCCEFKDTSHACVPPSEPMFGIGQYDGIPPYQELSKIKVT